MPVIKAILTVKHVIDSIYKTLSSNIIFLVSFELLTHNQKPNTRLSLKFLIFYYALQAMLNTNIISTPKIFETSPLKLIISQRSNVSKHFACESLQSHLLFSKQPAAIHSLTLLRRKLWWLNSLNAVVNPARLLCFTARSKTKKTEVSKWCII